MRLEHAKNIGKTIAKKLITIGIKNMDDLQKTGSVEAFKRMQIMTPEKLPVCYNLYSLEGALQNRRWSEFSDSEKL